jgi:hypothetical protein
MPMNLQQFKTLSEEKQHRNLLLYGICVADKKTGNTHTLLFQLHSFYVEVFFNEDGDEVVDTRSFEDMDELEPYLEQIDLKGMQ